MTILSIRDFITAHGCTYYDDDIDKGIISNYFRLKNGICVEQQITVRQADAVCTTTLSCPVPADNQQLLIWALSVTNDINRHIDNGCFFVDLETGDVRFRSYFSPGNTIYTEDIDMFLGYPKKWFRSMGNVIKFSDTGYEETLIMNECIRQRMHFFCKMCMTRKQIEESA